MSASWASERRAFARAGLVLLLCAALPGAGRAADTLEVAKRVQVGPGGVIIEDADSIGGDGRVRVNVDLPHVRIEGDDEVGLVRVFSDAEVSRGERVEGDAVAVFGSLRVAGEVTGAAVAVFGSVVLEPGSRVDGDVVAVGGTLDHANGAQVGGQSVSIGFLPSGWGGAPATPMLVLLVLIGALMSWVYARVLTWIFPDRMPRIAATAGRQPLGAFGLGLVSVPLLVVFMFLLFVTFIGAPVAVLLLLAYLLASKAGQLSVTGLLGARLLRNGQPAGMRAMTAGIVFLTAFYLVAALLWSQQGFGRTLALFFLLLGVLLSQSFAALGMGAVLLSRFGARGGEPRPGELAGAGAGSEPAPPPMPA